MSMMAATLKNINLRMEKHDKDVKHPDFGERLLDDAEQGDEEEPVCRVCGGEGGWDGDRFTPRRGHWTEWVRCYNCGG